MKFFRRICWILCFALLLMPVLQASAAQTDASVTAGCHSVEAARPLGGSEAVTETAGAVMLYERTTGTLIYGYHADERIYPSSMVKLMTVIVALENGDPDEYVTVTRSALNHMGVGVVSVKLQEGERLKLRDLLYCVMAASANDASTVVAEHIGGSQAGFVAMMNAKVAEIGCTGTNFTNAHGLHDENCYTTARDILRILEYGLENDEFRAMFEATEYTIDATNKSDTRVIETTNSMMIRGKYYDDRVTGGKTGSTDAAGRCLAVTAVVGDMELVGIVMGAAADYSEDGYIVERNYSFDEMSDILDLVQDQFESLQLFYTGQVISQYSVENGSNNVVTQPVSDGYCILPKGITPEELTWDYARDVSGLAAPVEAGQRITGLEVWYGDICLAVTDLVAVNPVGVYVPYEEPKGATDMKDEQSHGQLLALILGIVLGVIIVAVVGIFLLRLVRVAMIRARIRKRRRNRRRNRNARME